MLDFSTIIKYKSESEGQKLFDETILINFLCSAICFFFIYSINNYFLDSIQGFFIMMGTGISLSFVLFLYIKKKISHKATVNIGNIIAYLCLGSDVYYSGGIHSPTLAWIILLPMASFLMLGKGISTRVWLLLSILLITVYGLFEISGIVVIDELSNEQFPVYLTTSYIGLACMLAIMTSIFDKKTKRIFEELVKNQGELAKSEKRFRTIFETAPLGISVANSITGQINEFNLKYAEIVGRNEEEIKILNWESYTHPDDIQEDLDNMNKMLNDDILNYKQTKRYIRPDGSIVWVDMSISPIDTDDFENPYHLCMVEDITIRKDNENKLKEEEKNTLLLRHASQVPGVIYQVQLSTDDITTFPFVSNGVIDLFGITPEEVLKDAENVLNCVHPEDLEELVSSTYNSMKSLTNWEHDFRIILKSNDIRWLRGNSKPELLKDGTVICHGYIIDITNQKNAEKLNNQKNAEKLNHQNTLLELNKLPNDLDFNERLKTILTKTAEVLNCERVSFWILGKDHLKTEYIYKLSTNEFLEGSILFKSDCGIYYKEIIQNKNILANDVITHPSLFELEHYFKNNNISSLLDIPVQKGIQIIGVICHEHVGEKRNWTTSELAFTKSISDYIAFASESEELKKAKDEINQKEERWKFAIEASTDGMWDWNLESNEIYRSTRWSEILGYESNEIINSLELFTDRIHPDDIEMVSRELNNHFRLETTSYSTEHRVLCKDNSYKWILDRGKVIVRDENKKPLRVVGTKTDISDRKKAEEELQQSKDKLEAIYSGSNDAIMLLNDKGFIDGNPRTLELFGFIEKSEFTRCHPSDISPEFQPDGQNSFEKANEMVQIAFEKGINRFEWDHKHTNGKIFPAEVLLSAFNYGGERILQATVIDITNRKLAEKELENQKEFYESILNNIPTEIIVFDKDHKYLFVNPSAIKDLELRKDVIGKDTYNYNQSINRENEKLSTLRTNFLEVKEKGKPQEWENTFTNDDGSKNTFFRGMVPIYNFNQELKQVIGYGFDITRRKITEYNLQKSEERLQLVLAGTNDGWWDWDLIEDTLYYSPRWWAMFGYIDNEIELIPSIYLNYIHPDDRERVENSFKIALNDGTTSYEIECRLINRQGNYIPILSRGYILRDTNNIPIRVSGSDMDLSERKLAEDKIKQSEEKYRSLIETSPEIIMITDRDQKIQFINFVSGNFEKDDIVGESIYEFVNEKHHEEIQKAHESIFNGAKSAQYETEGTDSLGNIAYFITHVGPKYLDDQVVGLVLFISNITDRKIYEVQIKQSLEEKEILLKEVHHRVKNNLQIISSILNLQSSTISDQQTLDLLKNSQDRIRSMSLIHELLYQTKDFSTINFSEYIRSIATNLFQSYNQNKLIDLSLELETVFLDLDSAIPCGLIINELITNSLKYAYPNNQKGAIKIGLNQIGKKVILIIEDNGQGFPTRIDFRETESLGMQLVISLTDQIDGEIELNTSAGTKFTIQFNNVTES